jgi:mitochondrial fission protein ELM1
LRQLKRASSGRTFTVYVNAPVSGSRTADLIVAPQHDGLRGGNVMAPLTPPNRLSPAALAQARATPDPRIAILPEPRIALLIGGNSRHYRFGAAEAAELSRLAHSLAAQRKSFMATVSRRTPPEVTTELRGALDGASAFLWDGEGANPYVSMLACAQAIVVTADSVNMIGEAVATGAPVHIFEPRGGRRKISAYIDALETYGAVRRWKGQLERWTYEPLNSTPAVAREVARAYAAFRRTNDFLIQRSP